MRRHSLIFLLSLLLTVGCQHERDKCTCPPPPNPQPKLIDATFVEVAEPDPQDEVEDEAYKNAAATAHAGTCTWPYREEHKAN